MTMLLLMLVLLMAVWSQPVRAQSGPDLRSSAPSQIQGIPTFDVERYCRVSSAGTEQYVSFNYKSCLERERLAFEALEPQWAAFPEKYRQVCGGWGGQLRSYSLLQRCLLEELKKPDERKGPAKRR